MVLKVDGTAIDTGSTGLITDNSQSVTYTQVKKNGTEVWQTRPTVVPSITYDSTAEAGDTITVSWGASSRAGGYKAEYSKNNGINWTQFYSGTGRSKTITVSETGSWMFRVRAYNYSGTTLQYNFNNSWKTGGVCTVSNPSVTVTITEANYTFFERFLYHYKRNWGFNLGYPASTDTWGSTDETPFGSINTSKISGKTIHGIMIVYDLEYEGSTGSLFGGEDGSFELYGPQEAWTFEFWLQGTLAKDYIVSVLPQGTAFSTMYASNSTHIQEDGITKWKWAVAEGSEQGLYGWDGEGTRIVIIEING